MEEMKRLKEALKTVKYYCRDHDDCKGCIFHDDRQNDLWFACQLRQKSPNNWDTDKLKDLPKLTDTKRLY